MPSRRDVPVARHDELELAIDALGEGPDGIAHVGDYVVFVPGTLPGERITARVTSAARKFGRAELLELHTASPERVEPPCPHFLRCGGCHRQHQQYAAQLRDKQARLQRALDHALGGAAPPVEPCVPARPPHGQRHKVALHLRGPGGRLQACFHRLRSPELVGIDECPASDPLAFDLGMRTIELLNRLGHGAWDPDFAPRGLLRTVLVRSTLAGEAHVVVVARQAHVPGLDTLVPLLHQAGATTISANGNAGEFSQLLGPETVRLSGPPRIAERLLGTTYLLSPTAFFQTAPQAAGELVQRVLDWLLPGADDAVGDLYCGGGLLTLPLAQRARAAFGIELSLAAVRDAEAAARENGLANVQFRHGDCASWLAACGRELPRPDLVALDPPRSGLEPEVVRALGALRPRRLAYVSCEPQALARDLAALQAAGFRTARVTPVDMFPHTAHVESLACLERTG